MAQKKSNEPADLSGALHDVSNALTVLLGWVGEARAPGASVESIAYALRIIEERARAARDLSRRAIGVSLPVADTHDLLDHTLTETLDALALEAQRAQIVLHFESQSGTAARVPAATDLSQIVTNMVMNALAHAPRGSTIAVTAETSPMGVSVDVEDEGPGIALERHASIFEGDSTREGGSGVGLRHARALARSNGGDLALIPTPAGAFFRLSWPRVGVMPSVPPSAARVHTLEGTRVLVLEDDADVTILLETALGARGARVTVAHDAAGLALALVKGPFDAALIDLSPIAEDVAGNVAALVATSPGIALVFITGTVDALPEVISPGGVRWVRKPFEVREVVAALTETRKKTPHLT